MVLVTNNSLRTFYSLFVLIWDGWNGLNQTFPVLLHSDTLSRDNVFHVLCMPEHHRKLFVSFTDGLFSFFMIWLRETSVILDPRELFIWRNS